MRYPKICVKYVNENLANDCLQEVLACHVWIMTEYFFWGELIIIIIIIY